MKEWKVKKIPVGDHYLYQPYLIRNPKEPMHSGNVIDASAFESERDAELLREELNKLWQKLGLM